MQTYEYGAPLITRTSDIAEKCKNSTTLFPIEVMGKYQPLKQITVRIGYPVYRIENGRTRTFQKEYLATHPDAESNLFTHDPESFKAQYAQHQILRKLAEDEDLLKEFQNGTQQTEPIIITNTGVVVNGNRRLCAWRKLYADDPERYKYFEFIQVAVLPDDCDEDAIRMLEKRLQIQKSHRAEYKWHTKATMMKEDRENGIPNDVLAKSYDVSKKEVDTLIGALEYAEMYLRRIGKPDQWSYVDGDEFAFKGMVDERKRIGEQGRKELFETVCFKLIELKDYKGRLYDIIPEIAEHLDAFVEALREMGMLTGPDTQASGCDTGIDSEYDENITDDLDLLGGETTEVDEYSMLATAIQGSSAKLGELVKQVIDDQKAIKDDKKSSQYLINTLAKASRYLTNARLNGLTDTTNIEGVANHIDNMRECLDAIEKWLQEQNY